MRNLAEYPITVDEIVQFLEDTAAKLAEEERVGDMGPLLLLAAKDGVLTAAQAGWKPA